MHFCSNDLENISRLYLVAIVFSAVVFFVVLLPGYSLLDTYFGFKIPIWIETPSIIGLYGLFINFMISISGKSKDLDLPFLFSPT